MPLNTTVFIPLTKPNNSGTVLTTLIGYSISRREPLEEGPRKISQKTTCEKKYGEITHLTKWKIKRQFRQKLEEFVKLKLKRTTLTKFRKYVLRG